MAMTATGSPDIKPTFMFYSFIGLRHGDMAELRGRASAIPMKARWYLCRPCRRPSIPSSFRWVNGQIMDAKEAEGCKRPVGVSQCPVIRCIQQGLEEHDEACWNIQTFTFHWARHTFATMTQTVGTDIYTTSKLFAHTSIHTTEIHADVVM